MFESLPEFMIWLGTGAGAAVAFSFLAELFPAWHKLEADAKKVVSSIGSVLIALLAFFGLQYIPADVIAAIDPYFKVIVGVLGVHFSGQLYHQITKK